MQIEEMVAVYSRIFFQKGDPDYKDFVFAATTPYDVIEEWLYRRSPGLE